MPARFDIAAAEGYGLTTAQIFYRMPDHLELAGRSVGEPHRVDVEVDDAPRVDAAGGELHAILSFRQCRNSQVSGTFTPSARIYAR